MTTNVDTRVVADFGDEWATHDQAAVDEQELRLLFDEYFSIFPWAALPPQARGFDLGCGSWAVGQVRRLESGRTALRRSG